MENKPKLLQITKTTKN